MATKTWKIEKDLCRCCHAEGTFDNLAEPRIFLEKEEIYSDMLRECLDIDIPPVPGELCAITYTICSTCITRLRDACNFKKQVQDCEQRFMTLYYKNAIQGIKPETIVKEEFDVTIEDANSEGDVECIVKKEDDDDDDDDDDVGITGAGDDDDDSDDYCIKRTRSSTKATPKATPKAKPKAKPKAPVKKEKPSPQAKKKPEPKAVKEKKGDKPAFRRQISFRMQPSDYRIEGARFACGHCDKTYDKHESLRFHVKSKHYRLPKHECRLCGETFMTSAPFTVHKLREHNLDERFHCNACKSIFNTKVQLRKHINNFHMLGERQKCPLCDYESFSFEGMYKHKYVHKTEKDHQCRFCKKAFVRKTTLDLHERIHTGDRRKVCKICGQAFVQKASLNYHMNKYHPEVNY